jgi:hypothetical protein
MPSNARDHASDHPKTRAFRIPKWTRKGLISFLAKMSGLENFPTLSETGGGAFSGFFLVENLPQNILPTYKPGPAQSCAPSRKTIFNRRTGPGDHDRVSKKGKQGAMSAYAPLSSHQTRKLYGFSPRFAAINRVNVKLFCTTALFSGDRGC